MPVRHLRIRDSKLHAGPGRVFDVDSEGWLTCGGEQPNATDCKRFATMANYVITPDEPEAPSSTAETVPAPPAPAVEDEPLTIDQEAPDDENPLDVLVTDPDLAPEPEPEPPAPPPPARSVPTRRKKKKKSPAK
jgi:hypothetical protein